MRTPFNKSTFVVIATLLVISTFSCKSNSQEEMKTVTIEKTADKFSDVTIAQAKKMISDNKNLVVLDVRTPQEIAEGKIEGAIEIDIYSPEFNAKMAELDKDKEYLVYCRSGGRSGKCLDNMKEMGFTSAHNMLGGFNEWKK